MSRRITIRIFLGAAFVLHCGMSIVYSESGIPSAYTELMKQRASFNIAGTVVDVDGVICSNVTLHITERRYNPNTLDTEKFIHIRTIDGNFEAFADDVTSIEIRVEKEGYHSDEVAYRFKDLYEAKRRELEKPLSSSIEQRSELYSSLKHKETNVVLVLEKVTGPLARELKQRFSLKALGVGLGSRIAIQGFTPNTEGFDIALELIHSPDKPVTSRLYLVSPTNGGFIVTSPADSFHQMKEAPRQGYCMRVDISDIDPKKLFSFYLKSPNSEYAKATVGAYYFNPLKGDARVILDRVAIQTNDLHGLTTLRK